MEEIFKNLLRIKIASSALDNSGHMSRIRPSYLLGEAKVTDLGIHLCVHKYIAGFHVPVYYSRITPIMQVVDPFRRK